MLFLPNAAAIIIFPIGNMKQIITPADIGAAVRRARKVAGLRQDDLAGLAGVGTRFLIELEAGKPTMRLDKLLAVLATLGIELHVDGAPE
jgi:HTH-type transcriptional regulator / antitoxin HipB